MAPGDGTTKNCWYLDSDTSRGRHRLRIVGNWLTTLAAQTTLFTINLTTGAINTSRNPANSFQGQMSSPASGHLQLVPIVYAYCWRPDPLVLARTTLYTINLTTGALTQVGTQQTHFGGKCHFRYRGIYSWFLSSMRIVGDWNRSNTAQTTLYTINLTTGGVDTSRNRSKLISGVNAITGIGAFTVGSYRLCVLLETGHRWTSGRDDALHYQFNHRGVDTSRNRTNSFRG